MIGGNDIWFENGTEKQWFAAQEYFKSLWSDLVMEIVPEEKRITGEEIFIYSNQEVMNRINKDGYIADDLDDQFVYLLRNNEGFTVVVGNNFNSNDLISVVENHDCKI